MTRNLRLIVGITLILVLVTAIACAGDQGSAGPQGPQGPQGAQGSAGSQGLQGDQGAAGAQGQAGPQGLQGEGISAPAPLVATGAAIDVHTHVMSQALTDGLTGGGVPASTADDLIARLDEANVQQAVVLALGYWGLPDDSNMAPENDFAAAEVGKYPDRLIGFCGINPLYESAVGEIDRCLDLPGMVGVKLHLPGSRVDLKQPDHVTALSAVFDKMQERDAPVLMHAGAALGLPLDADEFASLAIVLSTYSDVRLVLAHCTNDADRDEMEIWLAALAEPGLFVEENLFVDITSCLNFYNDAPLSKKELMVWRLRKWGLERVLFGSDYLLLSPDATPAEALEIISSYPFTQTEIDLILSNDASAWLFGP